MGSRRAKSKSNPEKIPKKSRRENFGKSLDSRLAPLYLVGMLTTTKESLDSITIQELADELGLTRHQAEYRYYQGHYNNLKREDGKLSRSKCLAWAAEQRRTAKRRRGA